jgi:adenylate kinase
LIFVGGARGSGKTTLLKALKQRIPQVEHFVLAEQVNRITNLTMFKDDYVGMRRLTPDQQYEAVSSVIKGFAEKILQKPSRLIFIDGHYVSSSYIDDHEAFFPCLGENVRLLEKMIWVKIEPHEIMHRRYVRERIPRTLELTVREYFAEGIEAKFLERRYGTQLLTCRDNEFFDVVYSHFDQYLDRAVKRDQISPRRKIEAVLQLLRGYKPEEVAQELGVTVEALSEWLQRFMAAGSAEFRNHGLDGWSEEIGRLKALVREMTAGKEGLRQVNSLADSPRVVRRPRS